MNGSRLDNTTYYYANGEIVARKDSAGSMHYYHGDQLGSTSLITDASGNVEETTKYYPFGALRSGGNKTKYLYNGKELESATGLYDYCARQYNPLTMHFIEPDTVIQDPYDPQMLNRYSYVKNNPVKYTDPTGHFIPLLFFAIVGAGGIGYGTYAIFGPAERSLLGAEAYGVGAATAMFVSLAAAPETIATSAGSGLAWTEATVTRQLATSGLSGAVNKVFQDLGDNKPITADGLAQAALASTVTTGICKSTGLSDVNSDIFGINSIKSPQVGQFAANTIKGVFKSPSAKGFLIDQLVIQTAISQPVKTAVNSFFGNGNKQSQTSNQNSDNQNTQSTNSQNSQDNNQQCTAYPKQPIFL